MNTPERKAILQEKAQIFKDIARAKNYHEETIQAAAIIACSSQMKSKFGDTPQCLDKIIELCKQFDDGSEFIAELAALAGLGID